MQVRCLACGRWLFEVRHLGLATLRVRCTKCKQNWEASLNDNRVQLIKMPDSRKKAAPGVESATESDTDTRPEADPDGEPELRALAELVPV